MNKILLVIVLLLLLIACSQEDAGVLVPKGPIANPASPIKKIVPIFAPKTESASAGVVVEVNDKRFLASELSSQLSAIASKSDKQRPTSAQLAEIRSRLINDFIARTLLEEELGRQNIIVPTAAVDRQMDKIAQRLPAGMSLAGLLKERGVAYQDFRRDIIFSLKVAVMVEKESPIKITAAEIADFYEKNKKAIMTPEMVRIRQILIAISPADTREQRIAKKNLAHDIQKKLLAGGDFATLAANFSDCPSRSQGGDLGYLVRESLNKEFAAAILSSDVGAFGKMVETAAGFHIIQVLDKRPPQPRPLDTEVRENIRRFIAEQKRAENFHRLLTRLRNNAQITVFD
ncbi:MAG: peptidylprolyl isomerase [Deltaproteobacteria bacterium]|nr:peptidylprolyl isomerase [Deltaproteobacteria bacterium]